MEEKIEGKGGGGDQWEEEKKEKQREDGEKKSRGKRRRASRDKAGIGPAWDLAERKGTGF